MKKLTFSQKILKPWLTAFFICLVYTIVGGMWVFFSEPVLSKWIVDPETFRTAKIISQWLFIVISAQLLFVLIRHRELAFIDAEETLFRANRALRVFSECKKATTWDMDEYDLLRKICRILVVLGGYRLAWVGYASDDEEKSVKPVAHWGYEEGYLNALNVRWDNSVYGQGPAGTTIKTGQTVIVRNIMSNPKFKPWREMALAHGFCSAISLPLHKGRKVYGVLVILASEAESFDPEEASQLEELTEDLANRIMAIHSKTTQKKAREEQLLLTKVIHQAAEGILTFDQDARVQYLNPSWEHICGVNAEDVVGGTLHELFCDHHNDSFYLAIKSVLKTGEASTGRYQNVREDGSHYEIEANISPVMAEDSEAVRYVAVVSDVTHEAELEEQLRTAQKMEAIATLAGGIAHDFNNILAAILTNTELVLDDLPNNDSMREHLEIVYQAGNRGKSLVKQILTISRQNLKERVPVSVEVITTECLNLLRASLPSTIEIRNRIKPNLARVDADPTQIHQVILNICTNAADAMAEQDSGVLEISMEEVTSASRSDNVHARLHPGNFLKLSIRDTGHGMKREILERIFDPFFTTKGPGKGTGLGLSVAHGIIGNHGGLINVESTPGQGTAFHIYLPQSYCIEELPEVNDNLMAANGHEKILLVDDEPALAFAGKKMLEKLGYDVIASTDSRKALQLFLAQPASFDMVITDQTMPYMTGDMLAREVLKVRAEVPIILCSGKALTNGSGISIAKSQAIGIKGFMTKPYERREMSQLIRRMLD
ncbi:MAG: GAF domain-containing protein [Desulfuromonadaceae bacterium]|nr:GAF domain-containing protein [Desulfuromonadaceae bacterium]